MKLLMMTFVALACACSSHDVTELSPASGAAGSPAMGGSGSVAEAGSGSVAEAGSSGAAGAGGSGGSGGGEPDCFENPTTHFELINACTNAVRVTRTPNLTLLEADGSLPPP